MSPDIFMELSIILMITVIIASLLKFLKQPSIIAYIVSGVVAGPFIMDVISATDTFNAFAQKGVALLLFLVGLSLNPKVIKDVGKISLITGVGQVVFTTSVGYMIARLLGFTGMISFYLSFALAFSSTIVIMKLLSDKKELETLYGRISVGFLIVQDFIVIVFLLAISSFSKGSTISSLALETVLKGLGAILVLFLLAIYVLPKVIEQMAKSQELLFLFSVSWCFAIASIFHHLNFSIEAGALLAGVALSTSPYHFEISAKLRPLRDFFLILFFIMMGSQMIFENIANYLFEILALSFFVLVGNPIIVMILMGLLGYTKKNSFSAGLTVAQISEFSLIITAMGIASGHVGEEVLSIVTAVALITFAGSTYLILYADKVYRYLSRYLSIFEKKGRKVDQQRRKKEKSYEILIFGHGKIGFDILRSLKKLKKRFLVIDYDPEVIAELSRKKYACKYGDASDIALLEEIDFTKAKMVISTISAIDTNTLIISKAKQNKDAIIAVVSHHMDDALRLYEVGATYVVMPHLLSDRHVSMMIEKGGVNMRQFLNEKIVHVKNIKRRKRGGRRKKKSR